MAPSTPQGQLAGSKREHPFHLIGIHTQQSLTNRDFIPWPIWSPSLAILVPHRYCGEPPRTHSLHSSSQLDTHKVTQVLTQKLYHKKPKHKSPRAALWQVFIGSGAAYSFTRSANQLQALYLLCLGFQPLTLSIVLGNFIEQWVESPLLCCLY